MIYEEVGIMYPFKIYKGVTGYFYYESFRVGVYEYRFIYKDFKLKKIAILKNNICIFFK